MNYTDAMCYGTTNIFSTYVGIGHILSSELYRDHVCLAARNYLAYTASTVI